MTDSTIAAVADEAVTAAPPETAKFKGETFKLNPDVSEFAYLEFMEAVDAGEDADTVRGLASLLRFVLEVIHEDDRDHFRAVARRERATGDDLFAFLRGGVEAESERPTGPPGDSSSGPVGTPAKSAANSAGKVSPLAGRPDLLMAVEDAVRRNAA